MVKQRFFRRNQPTRQEQVLTPQPDWVSLAPLLQDALRQRWLQSQPIHLRCAVLEATLLVLVEHLLHFEPDPESMFNSLEATLQTLLLEFSTDSTLQDLRLPNPLPIQLLLRISGYQHPYATRKFLYALPPAEESPLLPDPNPQLDGRGQETSVGLGIPDATTPGEPERSDEGQRTPLELTQPELPQLELAQSELTQPELAQPEPFQPELTQPKLVQPELVQPELAQPELPQLELTQSELPPQLEPVQPELTQPELAQSELAQPELPQPELTQLELVQPELPQPELTQPELAQPKLAQSELTQLELAQSELTQPEPVQPEPTPSELTDQEMGVALRDLTDLEYAPLTEIPLGDAAATVAIEAAELAPLQSELASELAEVPSAPNLEPVEPVLENFSPEVAAWETVALVEPVSEGCPWEIVALDETTSEDFHPERAASEATDREPTTMNLESLASEGTGTTPEIWMQEVELEIPALEETNIESIETASENTAPTEVESEILNLEQIKTTLEPSVPDFAPDIVTNKFTSIITEIPALEVALEVTEPKLNELPEDATPEISPSEVVALEQDITLEREVADWEIADWEIADSGWATSESPEEERSDAEQAILEQAILEQGSIERAGETQTSAKPLAGPTAAVILSENLSSVVQEQPFALTEPVESMESRIEEHIDVEQNIHTNWGASDPVSNDSPKVSVMESRESTPPAPPDPIPTPELNPARAELLPELPPESPPELLPAPTLQTPTDTISNRATSQTVETPSSLDEPDPSLTSPNPTPLRWTASHLGLAGAIGGFVLLSGWYVLSRPCVLGGCKPLRQARHLSQTALQTAQSTESALALVESYEQLNESSYLIGTIPAWSRYHHKGQVLLDSYAEQAMVLGGVVKALEQANQAAQRSQNPPHPLAEWREIQWLWRDVIDQLGKISPDSSLYPLVQRKLAEYQANLRGINQRIGVEQQAQDRIDAARQAGQLAESRTSQAQSAEQWQETVNAWKIALEQLRLIPQGTMVYDEARQLLALYQPKLTESEKQQARELIAAESYGQTLNAAEQARKLESQNQWSQSRQYWQNALTYAQKIPNGTTYHSQVQPLLGTYTQKIQQAQENTHRSVALQTVQPSLEQICPASAQVCTYTLTPEAIRVQFTATYDQAVTLTIHQKQPTAGSDTASAVVNRVNQVLRTLANIGETTQVPIELYNASGARLGTYTPSLSGYVPQ